MKTKTILKCMAGKTRKRANNFVIPLVDRHGTEYGEVILQDSFGQDLSEIDFVKLSKIIGS